MFKKVLGALVLVVMSQSALAGKIVIVDFQQAIFGTKYAQEKLQEFSSAPETAKMKAQLDSLSADLEILNKEMKSKSMTWGESEKAEHRKKMEEVYRGVQAQRQQLEGLQNKVLQSIATDYQPRMEEVIKKYVEENNIDFIIRREAIAYNGDEKNDITSDITAELNKLRE